MDLTRQQQKGQVILNKIIELAWEDEEFKKSLIEKPKETLENYFKTAIPDTRIIKVTDQSDPNFLYINIPIKPNKVNDYELDKDQLEKVTGGAFNMNKEDFSKFLNL